MKVGQGQLVNALLFVKLISSTWAKLREHSYVFLQICDTYLCQFHTAWALMNTAHKHFKIIVVDLRITSAAVRIALLSCLFFNADLLARVKK